MLGAENAGLDACDQKVKGEKTCKKSGGEIKARDQFLYNGGEKERLEKREGVTNNAGKRKIQKKRKERKYRGKTILKMFFSLP